MQVLTETVTVQVMSYIGMGVEYALHCLLWIAAPQDQRPSSRDLATLQKISPAFLAKILQKLENAGIVEASSGIFGGYRFARPLEKVSVLDVVDAIQGRKALFECQEIRRRSALFEGEPPDWATRGTCGIHAVMLGAEAVMRDELAKTSLATLSAGFREAKLPPDFAERVNAWFADRKEAREVSRLKAMRTGAGRRKDEE